MKWRSTVGKFPEIDDKKQISEKYFRFNYLPTDGFGIRAMVFHFKLKGDDKGMKNFVKG